MLIAFVSEFRLGSPAELVDLEDMLTGFKAPLATFITSRDPTPPI